MSTPLTDSEKATTQVGSARLSKETWRRLREYCKSSGVKQGFAMEKAISVYLDGLGRA